MSVLNFVTSPNSGVKLFRGFLRSENSTLRFIFSGCASFSWFFIFFCCDRATRRLERLLEMKKVPLVIHLVKQESHRAGVGNHEADGAAQAVDKEQEPEWRVPDRKEHLHLVHIPPRVGDEEKARWVVEEDRGKQELRVYPQPVHMLAQVRGGPEVVELNEYLEGKVGQRVHYPSVLRPETLP